MKQEDNKDLLLKYLSMALPYNIYLKHKNYPKAKLKLICVFNDGRIGVEENCIQLIPTSIDECKPYLRSMSSMTEEERKEYAKLLFADLGGVYEDYYKALDYLNTIHVDYRGLIEKGLAIEVTESNNPYKE